MRKPCFQGSHVIFATNHSKGHAAAGPFRDILNAAISELPIDSDSMGTFSGEIPRPGTMLDALRGKVRLARQNTNERYVLVSEGAFGAAGAFGLLAQGIEMLLLHDAENNVEIIEQSISYETNYRTATLASLDDLGQFLTDISFGSHALVLYPDGVSLAGKVQRGIVDWENAARIFNDAIALSPRGTVTAMSDMRAHVNPTRMREISSCCRLLANRLLTECPQCGYGGFGIVATIPGLRCSECGAPTHRAWGEKHQCCFCKATAELPRADGLLSISPSECEFCNP